MNPLPKTILAIVIALVGVGIAYALIKTKPQADAKQPTRIAPPVEVVVAEAVDYPVVVRSQGEVLPRRETVIAAEVTGRVISVSERFEVGEDFKEGEVLLEIDPSDYAAAEANAASALADAQLALEREEAQALQAERDWEVLGRGKEPSDLVLRKPHLVSAKAQIKAAEAGLDKARRDLERTIVRAPYDCRIRSERVELGSFVGAGIAVAEVYSTGGYRVRLPVSLDDFSFIEAGKADIAVDFSAEVAGETLTMKGKLLRTEGLVDQASRSVFLVAEVAAQDGEAAARYLSPGLFVKAGVSGRTLSGVFKIPRKALYGKDSIVVVSPEDRVSLRRVKVVRAGRDHAILEGGLENGERVAISPLPQVIDNMQVTVQKQDAAGEDEPVGGEAKAEAEEG